MTDLLISGSVLLLGVLAGNEFATLLVHSAIERKPPREAVGPTQAIVHRMERFVPILMPLSMFVTILAAIRSRSARGPLIVATICSSIAVVITFVVHMPINARIKQSSAENPPADWGEMRRRWIDAHAWRVLFDIAAFALAVVALGRNRR